MTWQRSPQKTSQELRQRTGAGMMDCKKALEETSGRHRQGGRDPPHDVASPRPRSAPAARRSEGHDRPLPSPQRQGGRARRAELRDGLRGAHRRLQGARQARSPSTSPRPRRWPWTRTASRPRRSRASAASSEEQTRASGKPEAMIEKIVDGKIEAFYKDVDAARAAVGARAKKTIGDLVKEVSAKTGENIQVRRFVALPARRGLRRHGRTPLSARPAQALRRGARRREGVRLRLRDDRPAGRRGRRGRRARGARSAW